tara:strand:- start:2674 stop:3129 length:456 start_codon:yes stop_codon:yes gene_type:complete
MTSIDKLRQAVEEAPSGSKAATMRALLPSIERQISQGIHYRDIVEALNKNGFEISFNTFVVTLRRLRKEKKQEKEESNIQPEVSSAENREEVEPKAPLEEKVEDEALDVSETTSTQDLNTVLSSRDREDYGDKYTARKPIGIMGKNRSPKK